MFLPQVPFFSGGKRAMFTRFNDPFVLWAYYSTPVFRSVLSLHALISYELRAPCITCERVPDLSCPVLCYVVPQLAILPRDLGSHQ